ncbi:uncharacterized protein LOC143287619 [Babylonia areolata]|uniref:uncharacterized protein LOC143287619 n=1 Tax=Babylonia areolata TaxID=304850 RepID=UPI003FD3FF2A
MMLRLFVFLGVVASVCLAVSVNDCPANLPRNQYLRAFGNRCYQFVLDHLREFGTAENECRARGGHLVIIRDLATQNFLYNTLRQDFHYDDIVWIGLFEQWLGDYVWVDGSRPRFTHWAWDQPDGLFEECVAMDVSAGGSWHDYSCSDGLLTDHHERFICEFPLVPHTTPAITTPSPTTPPPTTQPPTTPKPTTQPPTTQPPTTPKPTTQPPTTPKPTTQPPTTQAPTTPKPTTQQPTTPKPTTQAPTTPKPTTQPPTTQAPTTPKPTTQPPTTPKPTTQPPTTQAPTTPKPTTQAPTTPQPTTSAPEQSTSAATTTTIPEGGCPPFNCNVDCGLSGYKVDDNNCLVCQCEE